MWLIQYAVFGFVAGAIARLIHPGRDPMNWFWTMLLGIGGAVVGGYIADAMGIDAQHGLMSWVFAIGTAILLLFLYHMMTAPRVTASGPATSDDYKRAVFDDLSRGPN